MSGPTMGDILEWKREAEKRISEAVQDLHTALPPGVEIRSVQVPLIDLRSYGDPSAWNALGEVKIELGVE